MIHEDLTFAAQSTGNYCNDNGYMMVCADYVRKYFNEQRVPACIRLQVHYRPFEGSMHAKLRGGFIQVFGHKDGLPTWVGNTFTKLRLLVLEEVGTPDGYYVSPEHFPISFHFKIEKL